LNSAALYAALSPKISNNAISRTEQIDLKGTRELMQLEGGPLGLALGGEFRRESIKLEPTSGTDKGNIIGLGYSAYDGTRNVTAVFAEIAAPITKQLELSGAVRGDHYSDVGNSFTPKVGVKFTPLKEFALRATYAEGFRAPSSAENGKGGLAAFSTAADPIRCALGVTSACSPGAIAIITSPNPALKPEKSKSYTLGLIFDPLPNTSVSLDAWEINRKNEINQEQTDAALRYRVSI
jgi:iron complex outermembrane recepter protein